MLHCNFTCAAPLFLRCKFPFISSHSPGHKFESSPKHATIMRKRWAQTAFSSGSLASPQVVLLYMMMHKMEVILHASMIFISSQHRSNDHVRGPPNSFAVIIRYVWAFFTIVISCRFPVDFMPHSWGIFCHIPASIRLQYQKKIDIGFCEQFSI